MPKEFLTTEIEDIVEQTTQNNVDALQSILVTGSTASADKLNAETAVKVEYLEQLVEELAKDSAAKD